MKKIFIVFLPLIFALALSIPALCMYENGEGLYSDAVYMENLNTGRVIIDYNSTEKMFPASLTKVLTCIIAIEKTTSLDETFEIPSGIFDDIYAQGGANIALKTGEIVTISDLLHATLIRSACDSATALACYVSGSVEEFAKEMNAKAREIGALNSNFVNAHGLHDNNHFSSAEDMAKIAKYALQNETFYDIISKYSHTIPETNMSGERYFESTMEIELPENEHYYPHATGVKSGFTDEAGRCLITMAEKDGEKHLLVSLGANRDRYYLSNMAYTDAVNLYEYAFAQYDIVEIVKSDTPICAIDVECGVYQKVALITPQEVTSLKALNEEAVFEYDLPEALVSPVSKDVQAGTLTVTINEESHTLPLFPESNVEKAKTSSVVSDNPFVTGINFLSIAIFLISTVILVYFCLKFFKKKKAKK